MLSYGLHHAKVSVPNKESFGVPGVVSLEESSVQPELFSVYNDGALVSLGALALKSYSAKLTVHSEFDPPKEPALFIYSYIKHGRRGIGCLLNTKFVRIADNRETDEASTTPMRVTYELHTTPQRVKGKITSRILFEERLMGTDNFNAIEKHLYGQNDIKIDKDLKVRDLETRRFKVLYNRYGNWEVSGPDNLIRNRKEGVWEIDDINHINVNEDEFVLIDDYQEGETWLP